MKDLSLILVTVPFFVFGYYMVRKAVDFLLGSCRLASGGRMVGSSGRFTAGTSTFAASGEADEEAAPDQEGDSFRLESGYCDYLD